eukprot:689575-Pelagomonas_calceolata.AAC.7
MIVQGFGGGTPTKSQAIARRSKTLQAATRPCCFHVNQHKLMKSQAFKSKSGSCARVRFFCSIMCPSRLPKKLILLSCADQNLAAETWGTAPGFYPAAAYGSQTGTVCTGPLVQYGGSPPYAPIAAVAAPKEQAQAQPAALHPTAYPGGAHSGHVHSVDAGRFADAAPNGACLRT